MYEIPIQNQLLKTNQITAMHMMVAIIFIILGAITSSVPKDIVDTYDTYINIYGYIMLSLGIVIIILSVFFNKKIIQSKYNSILRFIEVIVLISILIYTFVNSWYLPFTYATTTLLGVIFAIIWEHHGDRKSTRLNSSHVRISYAVFCLKKKNSSYDNLRPHLVQLPRTDSSSRLDQHPAPVRDPRR